MLLERMSLVLKKNKAMDKWKFEPHDGATEEVRGSPKLLSGNPECVNQMS